MKVIQLLVDGVGYAVPLDRVVEIAARVRILPLAGVGGPIVGYLGYRGQVVPAIDLRIRLGRPAGPTRLDEHLVIARARRRGSDGLRLVALVVDRVVEVDDVDVSGAYPPPESAVAVSGMLSLPDGLLLIADLDRVLSLDEERAVDRALKDLAAGG